MKKIIFLLLFTLFKSSLFSSEYKIFKVFHSTNTKQWLLSDTAVKSKQDTLHFNNVHDVFIKYNLKS